MVDAIKGVCPKCKVASMSWAYPSDFLCLKCIDSDSPEMKRAEELAGSSLVPGPGHDFGVELQKNSKLLDRYMKKILGTQLLLLGEILGQLLDEEGFDFDNIQPWAIVGPEKLIQVFNPRDCQGLSKVVEAVQYVLGELDEADRMIACFGRSVGGMGVLADERSPLKPQCYASLQEFIDRPVSEPNPLFLLRVGHACLGDCGTYHVSVGMSENPMMDPLKLIDDIKRRGGDIAGSFEPNCLSAEWCALLKEEKCDKVKTVFAPDAFLIDESYEYQLRLEVISAALRNITWKEILSHSEKGKWFNKLLQEGGVAAVAEEA